MIGNHFLHRPGPASMSSRTVTQMSRSFGCSVSPRHRTAGLRARATSWSFKDTEVTMAPLSRRSYLRFEHSSLATAVSSLWTALTGSSPNSCSCDPGVCGPGVRQPLVSGAKNLVRAGGHGGYLRRGRRCPLPTRILPMRRRDQGLAWGSGRIHAKIAASPFH